jgi:GTPase SAR1 family protein
VCSLPCAEAEDEIVKLLLLGAGESGKSTLFKQILEIYGDGYATAQEKLQYISPIMDNITLGAATLARHVAELGGGYDTDEGKEHGAWVLENLTPGEEFPPGTDHKALTARLEGFWKDAGVQRTFGQRQKFHLSDGTQYLMNNMARIFAKGYVPTHEDILRCRVRTTGIVETDFNMHGNQFKMIDVGGQKNERKKWIWMFEDVTAVIFVASISEYDQNMFEDVHMNRMTDSMELFEHIVNHKAFKDSSMILFLNKRDLLQEKLENGDTSFSTFFPEFTGDSSSYDEVVDWTKNAYTSRNTKHPNKAVFCHVTCATDTENVQVVFNSVKATIIERSVDESLTM